MTVQLGRARQRSFSFLHLAVFALVGSAIAACGGGGGEVQPTRIVGQPQNQTVGVGMTATFSISTSGQAPVSIQWLRGWHEIPGATSASYTTPPVLSSDDGITYSAILNLRAAERTISDRTSAATLTVVPAVPAIPGVFSATGPMVTDRSGHTATLLQNGKVLLVGGRAQPQAGGGFLASAELYDPTTNQFTATGSMSVPRAGHAATLLPAGKVVITGGVSDLTAGARSDAEIYDPAFGTFAPTGSMTVGRGDHTATLLPNGMVLIAGGATTGSSSIRSSAELYSPATGTFAPTGPMSQARAGHSAAPLSDGRVLLLGGSVQSAGDLYEPASGNFAATVSPGVGSWRFMSTATLPSGRVLVTGGSDTTQSSGTIISFVANGRLFDPATGSFALTGSLIWVRQSATATRLQDGRVLVFGGRGVGRFPERAEVYDPTTGVFSATVTAGAGREGHTATLLGTGKVLIVGGSNAVSVTSLVFDPL